MFDISEWGRTKEGEEEKWDQVEEIETEGFSGKEKKEKFLHFQHKRHTLDDDIEGQSVGNGNIVN